MLYVQELMETQEKLRLQSKEIKDAIAQRKLAMTEYTEVSDKYVSYTHYLQIWHYLHASF